MFQYGALPIINENDTVRVDELQRNVGDNDRLAAMVTNLLRAPLLVLLSDVEGLYDRHPREPGAAVIPLVTQLDAALRDFQRQAARVDGAESTEPRRDGKQAGSGPAGRFGRRERGDRQRPAAERAGRYSRPAKRSARLFFAQGPAVTSRKRWIGLTAQPCGRLVLDAGAQQAVEQQGRSLLAIGVRRVEGNFQKGDVVSLCRDDGQEFARGLTNYGSEELRRIAGQPTEQIVGILGHCPYDEVVHRDNLAILS